MMPDSQTLAALVSVPSAAAVVFTCSLFLRYMARQREQDRIERASDRLTWENHLSSTVRALQQINDNLSELRNDVRSK